ncbi:hypothetical protein K501DRAFT_307890 [Backusella circina FSU 941]|nr:hypothetical protein K501DRAFT_307890 [Backusella circina FSU 941]
MSCCFEDFDERTANMDVLMGVVKRACRKREDVKVVVISATMGAGSFRCYFNYAPLLISKSRMPLTLLIYPMPKVWSVEQSDRVKAVQKVLEHGDHLMPPNTYNGGSSNWCSGLYLNYGALQLVDDHRRQLRSMIQNHVLSLVSFHWKSVPYPSCIRETITTGFFMQVIHYETRSSYCTPQELQEAKIHSSSCSNNQRVFVLYHDLTHTFQNFDRI